MQFQVQIGQKAFKKTEQVWGQAGFSRIMPLLLFDKDMRTLEKLSNQRSGISGLIRDMLSERESSIPGAAREAIGFVDC
jgi:hypothetical protein